MSATAGSTRFGLRLADTLIASFYACCLKPIFWCLTGPIMKYSGYHLNPKLFVPDQKLSHELHASLPSVLLNLEAKKRGKGEGFDPKSEQLLIFKNPPKGQKKSTAPLK